MVYFKMRFFKAMQCQNLQLQILCGYQLIGLLVCVCVKFSKKLTILRWRSRIIILFPTPTLSTVQMIHLYLHRHTHMHACLSICNKVVKEMKLTLFGGIYKVFRRRQWHPTPVLLLGKSHGRRSLVGCSPWGSQSRTRLSDFTVTFHFHALEKEMATHSSVLAWRIPGTGEPGGLPSMGSHRVGHDLSY